MKKIITVMAEGFEEIELVAPVDLLRRAGAHVTVAGLNSLTCTGAHGIKMEADKLLEDCGDDYDMIVLPGGGPGTERLANSEYVAKLLKKLHSDGKIIAAICAAPSVLKKAGIVEGVDLTSYPGMEHLFDKKHYKTDKVVISGKIITSRGPGTAVDFGLALINALFGENKMNEIKNQIVY